MQACNRSLAKYSLLIPGFKCTINRLHQDILIQFWLHSWTQREQLFNIPGSGHENFVCNVQKKLQPPSSTQKTSTLSSSTHKKIKNFTPPRRDLYITCNTYFPNACI